MNHRNHSGTRLARREGRLRGGIGIEPLESRMLLAALLPAEEDGIAIERTIWRGHTVEARVDHWTGRLATTLPKAAGSGFRALESQLARRHPAWHATSLGGAAFSLVTPGASRQAVLGWASSTAAVQTLEPDFIFRTAAVPRDPLFASQWNLLNTGQYSGTAAADIRATQAWDVTTGSRSVVVAVVDSGLDVSHPDLAANIWTNPGEIAGNGLDDDHNGFVDDVHGWNFVDGTNDLTDVFGHGTHVAGIIGAGGDNGRGVAGVAWQVSLMGLKFQDARGVGSTGSMLAALNYATMMRRDHAINIVATNASWQAAGYSRVVEGVLKSQGDAGILFVAAAGNQGSDNDLTPRYPGGYRLPTVLSVAAAGPSGGLIPMSNYGRTTVDLAAPGGMIQSTFPNGGYGILSGTSMAAPHVSGVAALLAAAKPGLSAAAIRDAIVGSARSVAALAGTSVTGGMLDGRAALAWIGAGATTPPRAPPAAPPTPAPPAPFPVVDSFNQATGSLDPTRWIQSVGRIAVSKQTAVSSAPGTSLALLRGLTVADVRLQVGAIVPPIVGRSVGLVARHGGAGGDTLYLGRIVNRLGGPVAQIWVRETGTWRLLGRQSVTLRTGVLEFAVTGSRLSLRWNGRVAVEVRDATITAAGSAGVGTSGAGCRLDDFLAT